MIDCKLDFGRGQLAVSLPERSTRVLRPSFPPPLRDPAAALRSGLANPIGCRPLAEMIGAGESLAIVFCDYTRPAPSRLMIEAIVDSLPEDHGGPITLINALGLHRPNTAGEIEAMLGPDLPARFRLVQCDAWNSDEFVTIGHTVSGRPVSLARAYVEADRRITTGFVEPHFFAGFSGGAKLTLPGVAAAESILANHDAQMIDHSGATWGQTRGNPIFEEQRQAAALCPPDLIVNVALDAAKAITDVFCGELTAAHDLACRSVAKSAIVDVDGRFDLVITSNSGFPLDQNFYQAVKGLSAAARIVKPGGALVIASECSQGIGHGHFAEYLQRDRSPSQLLAEITAQPTPQADQWQAQILAQIQSKASVYVHSTGLDARAIRQIGCIPCPDISELADQLSLAAPNFAIAALPDGPLTIAQITETAANEIAAKNL